MYTVKQEDGTFVSVCRKIPGGGFGTVDLNVILLSGSCADVAWSAGDYFGTGCSISFPTAGGGTVTVSVVCACSGALLGSATVAIMCPTLLGVDVDPGDKATRPRDINQPGLRYFYFISPYRAGGSAMLQATVQDQYGIPASVWAESLYWESPDGSDCVSAAITSSGNTVRIPKTKIQTVCLT
ncbi:MAG: hypothetical protein JWP89_1581, partial [Schlesneria sp.]|nr:hypothetical protein [Schlesneria sp.]